MRILLIGGNGMLGHEAARVLSARHEVTATVRLEPDRVAARALAGCKVIGGVDVRRPEAWQSRLSDAMPEVVINCAGIVKQRVVDPADSIAVNALFPHQLAAFCDEVGARLVHISTDCVFSGRLGKYRESDETDPVDVYGRSKLLGEPDRAGCLTVRTSMIGLELSTRAGLVEWFLAQRGTVNGYRRAIWSGFTTTELARIISSVVETRGDMSGIWHVSSEPISKYDLLVMLAHLVRTDTEVAPDDSVVIDRSLNSDRFRGETGYRPPSHQEMLEELATAIRIREANRVA